jgi:general secretion pathway protein G
MSMKKKRFKAKGFTMVELLVVIGLLTILAGALMAIFNPFGQIQKSQDAKRKNDLAQIQRALELYYQDNGRYPVQTAGFAITGGAWGTAWGTYMAKVPSDPTPAKKYAYFTTGNGQTYFLYANLDRGTTDPQACSNPTLGTACPNAVSNGLTNACGGACNFGLTSSNATP